MEEMEVPTEKLQEDIHHHAEHGQEGWFSQVALSTALLAVLAAITALLAGHHANDAMIEQIRASDEWAHYQAERVKSAVLGSKTDLLVALGHESKKDDEAKLEKYEHEREEIRKEAEFRQKAAKEHLGCHGVLALGVTLFQVAIAVSAIAVLIRRPHFWYASIALGAVGTAFLVWGLILGSRIAA